MTLIPRDALRVSLLYLSTQINRLLTEEGDHGWEIITNLAYILHG